MNTEIQKILIIASSIAFTAISAMIVYLVYSCKEKSRPINIHAHIKLDSIEDAKGVDVGTQTDYTMGYK